MAATLSQELDAYGASGTIARLIYLGSFILLGAHSIMLGPFAAYDWLGLLAVLTVGYSHLLNGHLPVPPTGMALAGLLVLLGGTLTALSLSAPYESLVTGLLFAYVLIAWIPFAALVFARRSHLVALFGAIALSGGITGIAAVAQVAGVNFPNTEPQWGRMTGLTRHPNELGTFCAMATPFALHLVVNTSSYSRRLLWSLTCLAGLAGVALSVSLTGLASVTVAVACYLSLSGKVSKIFVLVLLTVAVIATVLVAEAISSVGALTLLERFAALGESGIQESTLGSRLLADQEALAAILENPLLGAGFGQEVGDVSILVHNAALRAWYEGGVFTFLGMAVALGSAGIALVQLGRRVKNAIVDQEFKSFYAAVLAAFLALGVTLSVSPTLHQRSTWFPVIAVLALVGIGSRHEGGKVKASKENV